MATLIEIGKKYPCSSQGILVDFEETEAMPGDIIECYFESDYNITEEQAHDVAMQIAKIKEDYHQSVIHYFKVEGRRITVQYSVAPPGGEISSRISGISFALPLWAVILIVIAGILIAFVTVEAILRGYLLPYKLPVGNAVAIAIDRVTLIPIPNVLISTDGMQGTTGPNGEGVLFKDLLTGDHTFTGAIIANYDPPSPVTVYVQENETVNVEIPYNPEGVTPPTHGLLIVNTDPVKGIVYIDGKEYGVAPVSERLTIGKHNVSFGDVEGWITPDSREITVRGDPFQDSTIGVYTKPGENWWEKYLTWALIGGGAIIGSVLIIPEIIRAISESRRKGD